MTDEHDDEYPPEVRRHFQAQERRREEAAAERAASHRRWTIGLLALLALYMVTLGPCGNRTSSDEYWRDRVGAICEDGETTTATANGACSGHGGVAEWLYE